ncbi:hypothetical protein CPB86DRAFT_869608 [Serendipita vermifera]|nr:hypothetical protein CPB86DRAFT_869608 [Serendipita vermifera]
MRAKCVHKALIPVSPSNFSRRIKFARHEESRHFQKLFLKPVRKCVQRPADERVVLLCTYMKEVQERTKQRKQINVINHGKLLRTDLAHTVLYRDPVVQWISFLLKNNRCRAAVNAFSFYLHQGASFSPLTMLRLCEEACILRQRSPLNVFTNHVCEMLRDSNTRRLSMVNHLIQILHIWAKQRAILRVGTVAVSYKDIMLQQQQHRYILRSALRHQRLHPLQHLYNRKMSTQRFLQFLNNWLHQRVEDGNTLDQYEIAMLIQGLSSLYLRIRRREPDLIHELDVFIHMLSRHASSQVAMLSSAEAYLDRLKGVASLQTSSQSSRQLGLLRPMIRESDLQPTQSWMEKDQPHEINFASLAQLARKARVLKILVRSRLHSGDISSVCRYMKDMALVHRYVATSVSSKRLKQASPGIGPASPLNRFNAKRFVSETQSRFTGALVLTSSNLLMAQDVSGLFSVLYFTRYLGSIYTFVRLWKRAIYLVAKQGKWEGATGLKALLSLLGESLPSGWDKPFIGSLLFESPDLVISTLRTVLQAPRSVVITLRPVPMDKDHFQLEGHPLAGVRKQTFDDWWQLVIPFDPSQWLPNALRPISERINDEEDLPLKERSFEEMNGMLLKKIQRH